MSPIFTRTQTALLLGITLGAPGYAVGQQAVQASANLPGCYRVAAGAWDRVFSNPGPSWTILPEVIRLDTTRVGQSAQWYQVLPSTTAQGRAMAAAHWQLTAPDSVTITWYPSRAGVEIQLRPSGDSLIGKIIAHGDAGPPPPFPTAPVTLRRSACPEAPVKAGSI